MKKVSCCLLCVMLFASTAMGQTKKYIKTPEGYRMVLRQGENVFAMLEELAKKEQIPSANVTGMGFVNATFGFFNNTTKEYNPKSFSDMELANMTGSIAWQNGKPSLHIHGVVTDKDFAAHGGHILAATVSTGSVELLVTVQPQKLERVKEEPLGANVLQLRD